MEALKLYEEAKSSEIWLLHHPPPSKPLPAIPELRYPSFLHSKLSDTLLSYSIPSPSIMFEEAMNNYSTWSTYSTDYSDAESNSVRTSFDTMLEYASNLLLPVPLSQKLAASTSSVDCRLRREVRNGASITDTVPLPHPSQETVTASRGEYEADILLKAQSINRRSSAIIPCSEDAETTISVLSLDLSRSSTTTLMEIDGPITPPSQTIPRSTQLMLPYVREHSATRVRIHNEPALRNISPPMHSPKGEILERKDGVVFFPTRPAPSAPTPDEGQQSFMLWDDEVDDQKTRVARVKKSLVDLRNPGRLRSQSVPIQPARNTTKFVNAGTKYEQPPMTCNEPKSIAHSVSSKQVEVAVKPSQALSWLSRKKSKNLRRATIGYENTLDTEFAEETKRQSAISTVRSTPPSPLQKRIVAAATTDTPKHADRRKGFARMTRWMKKLMRSS